MEFSALQQHIRDRYAPGTVYEPLLFDVLELLHGQGPSPESLREKYSPEMIVEYLQYSHRYYLEKCLPEMEQAIHILLSDEADDHPLLPLLHSFYREYKTDLSAHIALEERRLFPYIHHLLSWYRHVFPKPPADCPFSYAVRDFTDHHSDTEGDLFVVRETIEKYRPAATNQSPYRILSARLHAFEQDLRVHALMEDEVLIPQMEEIERAYKAAVALS